MSHREALTAKACDIAADLSGMAAADLPLDAPFLALGFDSLFLTQLAGAYSRAFGVKVTFRSLIETTPTLTSLGEALASQVPEEATPPAAPKAPVAPKASVPTASPTSVTANAASGGSGAGDAMAEVFSAQLTLMREQLRLLTGEEVASAPDASSVTAAEPMQAAPAPGPAKAESPALPAGFGPNLSAGDDDLLPQQAHHVARLTRRFNAKTPTSKAQTQRYRRAHADPRTAAGFDRRWKELVYPLVVERSEGAYLWDADGNRYIDMLNGFGPNFFGHKAPFITEALKAQLGEGYEIGPQTPKAGEVAELFCEVTGTERVSFVNTGSEAVQAAMRLARTVTGRDKVVLFEGDYHGNFDEVLVRRTGQTGAGRTFPLAPGIPFGSVENVIVLPYGEEASLDVIRAHADEIAAVLVEPVQSRRPEFIPKEFVQKLRQQTEEDGIVFVFDEVVTGFRTGLRGAQATYGVTPDLATYGKVLGGGMPIGAVAGKAAYMDTFDGGHWAYDDDSQPTAGVTFFAGTFVRHPLAMAAAQASLLYLKSMPGTFWDNINRRARHLATTLNEMFQERECGFEYAHSTSQMFLRAKGGGTFAPLFFHHMRDRGVHLGEGFPSYMTAAHTDEDVEAVIAAAADSLDELQADGMVPGQVRAGWHRSYPTTPAQQEIWIAGQLDPAAHLAFNESDRFVIEGRHDVGKLEAAVNKVLAENEAFYTLIDETGQAATVTPEIVPSVAVLDHRAMSDTEQAAALTTLLEREAQTPFVLDAEPPARLHLVRQADDRTILLLFAHHIASDGYSVEKFIEAVTARYNGEAVQTLAPFSVFAAGLPDKVQDDTAFWQGRLANADVSPLDWPGVSAAMYTGATTAATFAVDLDTDLAAISQAARAAGVSLSAWWMTAYALLIGQVTGRERPILGLPVAGQAIEEVDAIGYGVRVLPMAVGSGASGMTFAALAKALQRDIAEAMEHYDVSLGNLARALDCPSDPSRPTLIQAVFNYRKAFATGKMGEAEVLPYENARRHLWQELFLNMTEVGTGLRVDAEYRTAVLEECFVANLVQGMAELARAAAAAPDAPLTELLGEDAADLRRRCGGAQ